MGFFGRLEQLVDAGVDLAKTPVEAVVDLVQAPFTDDEYEGFIGTLGGVVATHGANFVTRAIGPEGVGGTLIGGLPEPVRNLGNTTLEGLEWAYREGVSQPISTVMTMASIGDSRDGFLGTDWGVWFDGEAWDQAREIAQTRSPGQAVTLAAMTDDILDEGEVARAEGNRWFSLASGTIDAAHRMFVSPEFLVGGGAMLARAGARRRAFDNYFTNGGYGRFADDVGEIADQAGGGRPALEASVADDAAMHGVAPTTDQGFGNPGHTAVRDWFTSQGETLRGKQVVLDPRDPSIPDTVFHVTASAGEIGTDGVLRIGKGGGLGGGVDGPERLVSFTTSRKIADQLAADFELRRQVSVAAAEGGLDAVTDLLRVESQRLGMPKVSPARSDKLVGSQGRVIDYEWEAYLDGDGHGLDSGFRHFLSQRETAGGPRNPIFTNDNNLLDWASKKADDIKVVEVPKENLAASGAAITDFDRGTGFLDEIRVYGDVPVGDRGGAVDSLAGRLREKYFPTHGDGDLIAHELAAAYHGTRGYTGGPQSMENVMRFFMGEATAIRKIAAESPAAAYRYQKLWQRLNTIEDATPPGTVGRNAKRFDADQDIPDEMVNDLSGAFASIDEILKPTLRRNLGDKVNHSTWYRTHWSMRPVRVMRDMRPQHFVWAGDANSGEQVARFLREAGYTPGEITAFRGEWARADRFARARTLTPEHQRQAIKRVVKEYFPDADKDRIADLLDDFAESSRSARAILTNVRKYDADDNLSTLAWGDEGIEEFMQVPLTPGQLEQTVALVDIKKLRDVLERARRRDPEALSKLGPVKRRTSAAMDTTQPVFDFASQVTGSVMSAWRAAVLLRPAWAMRVVGDEQFRMMAKIGTLPRLKMLWNEDWPTYVDRVLTKKLVRDGALDEAAVKRLKGRRALVTGGVGMAVAGPAGLAGGAALSMVRNQRAVRRLRRNVTVRNEARALGAEGGMTAMARQHLDTIGEGPLDVLGYQVDRALGDAVEPQILHAKANSANRSSAFLLDNEEGRVLAEVTEELGKWDTLHVGDVQGARGRDKFGKAWERVVNDQYGSNDVGRIAFDGTIDGAGKAERAARLLDWLNDAAGRGPQFHRNNPARFRTDESTQQWADAVVEAADRMLTEPSLRAKVAKGERVRFSDVRRVAKENGLKKEGWREYVGDIHHQEVTLVLDDSLSAKARQFANDLFDRIGTVTTDNLSRNPYFRHVYETDMQRRVKAFKTSSGDYELTEQALEAMQESARRKALQETRDLLYDLAERSEFSDMMRNVMPFFNAWQEVLSRWAGLAVENPAWVARASQVLRQDFDVGGYFQTVEIDDEKYFQFRLPEFAKDVIGSGVFGKAIDEQGTLRFRADSINMVTQVVPGVGPIVQVAASKIVDYDPDLEDAFRLVLPYGPTRGGGVVGMSLEAFQPAWVKRVTAALSENRSFESQAATIMLTRMAEMADGDRPQIDFGDGAQVAGFLAEVKADATNFMYLRAVASAFSPASVGFHSPYQDYIDQYRRLKAENPHTADDEFLKILLAEGQDGFFPLSARFSKSNEGLPATIEAEETRARYLDLIHRHPDIGGLIIGIEGGGQARFSAAVYERQLREETSPGSGMTRRERMSLQEILTDSRVREGWVEYGRVNDVIYNEMRARGLPNLRVAAARDLLAVKRAAVEDLGEQFPLWYQKYRNPDLTKWEDRIAGMRAIVKDERLAQRDDIRLLGGYLKMRDVVTGELAARSAAGGSGDISSGSNRDVQAAWEAWNDEQMVNPTFSDLLWRWLEFDPLSKVTWPKSQQEKK